MTRKAKAKARDERRQKAMEGFYFSHKNKKLVPTADTNFLIWSLPAIVTCPNATAHCKKDCYAVKAEKQYPDVLPSRRRNFEYSRRPEFAEMVGSYIRRKFRNQRKAKLVVRIHESGDFYNQAYADAWLAIAESCLNLHGIEFIAYTKSFRFFDGKALPKNFHLRASVWDDTKPEDLATIERNGWPIYTAVDKFTDDDTFHQCRCEDCATCTECWAERFAMIACEIH